MTILTACTQSPTATSRCCLLLCGVLLGSCSFLVDPSTEVPCASHSDCRTLFDGKGFCRPADKVCARLFTSTCSKLYYATTNPEREDGAFDRVPEDFGDDGIIFGFMGPPSFQDDVTDQQEGADRYVNPLRNAAILAIRQIQGVSLGVAQADGPQDVALLDCDDSADPVAVFRHLADQVQAPAVVGPVFSSTTRRLIYPVNQLLQNDHTLLLSPSATAIALGGFNELLWRTVPSDTYQVDALASLLEAVADGAPDRSVMMIACQELDPDEDPVKGWCFNFREELKVELNLPAEQVVEYVRPIRPLGPSTSMDAEALEAADRLSRLVSSVRDAEPRPAFIVGIGIGDLGEALVPELEAIDGYKPRYLFPEAERLDGLKQTIATAPDPRDLASRILGTAPGTRLQQDKEARQLLSAFLRTEDGNLGEFAYDAVFLLTYALYRSGKAHPNGRDMANALATLSCSEPDQLRLLPSLNYESLGQQIVRDRNLCANYIGLSGPLDFIAGQHQAPSDIGFWCPVIVSESGVISPEDVQFRAPPGLADMDTDAAVPYWDVTSEEASADDDHLRNPQNVTFCGLAEPTVVPSLLNPDPEGTPDVAE